MQKKYFALALLAATGCSKKDPLYCDPSSGMCTIDAAVNGDGAVDGGADADPGCFGSGSFGVCLAAPPTGAVMLSGTFNTGTSPNCMTTTPSEWTAKQPDACFVVGDTITVTALLDVVGSRPLVLLATSTISLNHNIDVSSKFNGKTAPGAPSPLCTSGTAPGGSTSGGGGGAGGSFVTKGGDGGASSGTSGTAVAAVAAPTQLRAGCDGQNGGSGNGGVGSGFRGEAGGAIYLVAGQSITIASGRYINASGAGAAKAGRAAGGGGGGSGGMIVLVAPTMNLASSFLVANGGGGSGGGENSGGGNAGDGGDPIAGTPLVRALGGTAANNAGDGGQGWAEGDVTAQGGFPGSGGDGGGGGGGGGGYIRTNIAVSGVTASPTAVVVP